MRITINVSDDLVKKVADLIDSYEDEDLIRFRHDLLLARVNYNRHGILPNDEGYVIKKDDVAEHILAGRKIQIIKVVRHVTGISLKDAKDFIEKYFYVDEFGSPHGPWVDFVKNT